MCNIYFDEFWRKINDDRERQKKKGFLCFIVALPPAKPAEVPSPDGRGA